MTILCTAPNCGKWFFGDGPALALHYKLEHALNVCANCGEEFAGELRIEQHHVLEHAPAADPDPAAEEELVVCVNCGVVLTLEAMEFHNADNHLMPLVNCSMESEAWSSMATVDVNEPPIMDDCSYSFDFDEFNSGSGGGGEEVGFSWL